MVLSKYNCDGLHSHTKTGSVLRTWIDSTAVTIQVARRTFWVGTPEGLVAICECILDDILHPIVGSGDPACGGAHGQFAKQTSDNESYTFGTRELAGRLALTHINVA